MKPSLMPASARERQRVRALAQLVACDIHPLNNLRVLQYFDRTWGVPQPERDEWVKHWIREGFAAFEALVADNPATGAFCQGDSPTLADCCLIPQMYNARRFGLDLSPYPTLLRIEQACSRLAGIRSGPPREPAGLSAVARAMRGRPRPGRLWERDVALVAPPTSAAPAHAGAHRPLVCALAMARLEPGRRTRRHGEPRSPSATQVVNTSAYGSCSPLAPSDRRNLSDRPSRESAARSASSISILPSL